VGFACRIATLPTSYPPVGAVPTSVPLTSTLYGGRRVPLRRAQIYGLSTYAIGAPTTLPIFKSGSAPLERPHTRAALSPARGRATLSSRMIRHPVQRTGV